MTPEGLEKLAVKRLSAAINSAIEESTAVEIVIEELRNLGYTPNINWRLEVGLDVIEKARPSEEESSFVLTEDDKKTLKRMKIKID